MLYVLDHVEKELHMIDPSPVPKWCQVNSFRKYGKTLTHFYLKYMAAMNVHIPGWNEDIYQWKFTYEKNIVQDDERG